MESCWPLMYVALCYITFVFILVRVGVSASMQSNIYMLPFCVPYNGLRNS